ncbi:MAG TPA: DUF1048 domain-containing protein [Candidatus Enterococcus stercoravium]|nr:DUF1048 domain-containing protein [Candidatus Enterococcus stercoravium]
MNLYDKITGNDMTKKQKELSRRVALLPQDYQTTWQELNQKLWQFSDFTGRNLYPILEGVLHLFEESTAEALPISGVIGENVDDFISEIARIEGAKNYRYKLRKQLNDTVAKKLGK